MNTAIVSIKRVANDGLQAEMVDYVQRPGSVNVLASLNKGDDRFKTGSPRRAWFPVTDESLKGLGLSERVLDEIAALEQGEKYDVMIENPTIDGLKLKIQIKETTTPDAWQSANIAKAAKQIVISEAVSTNRGLKTEFDLTNYKGQIGYFLDENSNFIFSRASVTVEGQVKHQFIDGSLVPETELPSQGVELASSVSTKVAA